MIYEVQWKHSVIDRWDTLNRVYWFRSSAAKYAAKQAINPNTVREWRIVSRRTGKVILTLTKEDHAT